MAIDPGAGQPDATELKSAGSNAVLALAGHGPQLAADVGSMFTHLWESRDRLRAALAANDHLQPIPAAPAQPGPAIAAVDGSRVIDSLYAVDLLAVMAVAANGQHHPHPGPLPFETWSHLGRRAPGNDQIAKAAMFALELSVLAQLPHSVRIIDGTHHTPLIALTQTLATADKPAAKLITDLMTQRDVPAAWDALLGRTGTVLALPKADTSTAWCRHLERATGMDLQVPDKVLTALLLEPGEMLTPIPVDARLSINTRAPDDATADTRHALADVADVAGSLRDSARSGQLNAVYLRAHCASTTTCFHILTPDAGTATATIGHAAAVIDSETAGPHIQEPFPQFMADQEAKKIALAVGGLRHSLIHRLPAGATDMAPLLLRGYRS